MGQLPLISLQLLADRTLNPGAVEIRVGAGDENEWLPLLGATGLSELLAESPGLISSQRAQQLSPAFIEAAIAAGVRISDDTQIHRSDAPAAPVLPTTAQWLAGDWCVAPPVKSSQNQTGSRALSLKLLQKVADDADTCEIEAIFRHEPVLAYHLLRLVNSCGVGVGRTISSFSQAILILGRQQLKRWLNLMLFAANRDDHRSAMLLARVAVRARNLELMAKESGMDRSKQEYAFMAGMFSLLGCLFGMELSDILKPLKLPDILSDALLRREGEVGHLLNIAEKSEQADDEGLADQLAYFGLSFPDQLRLAVEAQRWMQSVSSEQRAVNV